MSTYTDRFTTVADAFTDRVDQVPDDAWDRPAPCDGWRARDIIGHLVEWVPHFLAPRAGTSFDEIGSIEDDPADAWHAFHHTLAGFMADPEMAARSCDGPMGETTFEVLVDQFITNDILIHTWDLARATGLDETLDHSSYAGMVDAMEPMDAVLRSSGHYGPRVPVPADADEQTRLIAFMGRNPY